MTTNIDSYLAPPSKDQLQAIRTEISEDVDRALHFENLLHTWMNCQPHFPKNYDKRIVRNFLRSCKYNLERAKTKLEYNFTVRHLYPELFSGRSATAQDVVEALDTVTIVFMPRLTENGNRLSFYRLENYDAANFDVYATSKLFFMMYDLLLTSQHPVAGDITIFDGTNFNANHFVKLLTIIKLLTPLLRRAYAMRLKEIHIVNTPPLLDKILSVVKPILHHKVKNSFITHSSNTSLCDHFGEEILPSNYGGKCKSLEELMKDSREILDNNEEWFFEQESVKITEAAPKKIEKDLYFKGQDMQGSFRALQID